MYRHSCACISYRYIWIRWNYLSEFFQLWDKRFQRKKFPQMRIVVDLNTITQALRKLFQSLDFPQLPFQFFKELFAYEISQLFHLVCVRHRTEMSQSVVAKKSQLCETSIIPLAWIINGFSSGFLAGMTLLENIIGDGFVWKLLNYLKFSLL